MTPQSVCRLIVEGIREGGFSGPNGPLKAFAEEAQVSPGIISKIYQGKFPGETKSSAAHNAIRFDRGKVFSLTRICDLLALDLDTCLKACRLPNDPNVITESRMKIKPGGRDLALTCDDLDMLKKQVEIIGPVPVHIVPQLVKQFRGKKQ